MSKQTYRPRLEVLEDRLTPSTTNTPPALAANPGNPQAVNSNNLVAIDSSQVIHNGPVVSATAAHGARGEAIQALLGHS